MFQITALNEIYRFRVEVLDHLLNILHLDVMKTSLNMLLEGLNLCCLYCYLLRVFKIINDCYGVFF